MVTRAKRLTERERLIYMAGMFDGEGCISIGKGTSPKAKRNTFQLFCTMGMTHQATVEAFQVQFGGNVYHRINNHGHRQAYDWRVSSLNAAATITALLPFLIIKREQALLGLELQSLMNRNAPGRPYRVSAENWNQRENIYWKVRELNTRVSRAETKRGDPHTG